MRPSFCEDFDGKVLNLDGIFVNRELGNRTFSLPGHLRDQNKLGRRGFRKRGSLTKFKDLSNFNIFTWAVTVYDIFFVILSLNC